MRVTCEQNNETLRFAASELQGYLDLMGAPDINYRLGVTDLTACGMPAVSDSALDDQYLIDVRGDAGVIRGNNPRSVLLGVYRYLSLTGCAFLRPGKEYEVVRRLKRKEDFFAFEKRTASLRHRGVCIEGSVAPQNILDFIDWLPKVGCNAFFSQFETPHTFLTRYYSDGRNPFRASVPWTMEDSKRVMEDMDAAMRLRGLLQHRVGHGWTGRALGLSSDGWAKNTDTPDEKHRAMIAEVNGKRALWGGIPANTNLCMSNRDAVEAFAESVVRYARQNPSADYIHVWLADDCNNHCECEACGKKRPSDHYLDLLNRVDEKLSAIGSSARVVMLLYVDLLWAPEATRLHNPSRFVLMFAPITRSFVQSFDETVIAESEPPFIRNHLSFPADLSLNLRFLASWQAATEGCDCFDYDYYLARGEYGDPTHEGITRLISRDLKTHKALGLNGIISCQNLRNHFPNGIAGYVMGQTAFDTSLSCEDLAARYYAACYGQDGQTVSDLLCRVSACFNRDYLLRSIPKRDPEYAVALSRVPALTKELAALCASHAPCAHAAQEKMWEKLAFFCEYARLYGELLRLRAEGDKDGALRVYETEFLPLVNRREVTHQSDVDPWRIEILVGIPLRNS